MIGSVPSTFRLSHFVRQRSCEIRAMGVLFQRRWNRRAVQWLSRPRHLVRVQAGAAGARSLRRPWDRSAAGLPIRRAGPNGRSQGGEDTLERGERGDEVCGAAHGNTEEAHLWPAFQGPLLSVTLPGAVLTSLLPGWAGCVLRPLEKGLMSPLCLAPPSSSFLTSVVRPQHRQTPLVNLVQSSAFRKLFQVW